MAANRIITHFSDRLFSQGMAWACKRLIGAVAQCLSAYRSQFRPTNLVRFGLTIYLASIIVGCC